LVSAASEVLRNLATRRDLPNDLDLEHVAEEIEDVGNAELNSVRSFLRLMLAQTIKVASLPDSDPARHRFEEVVAFHIELFTRYSKSMRQRIDAQEAWELVFAGMTNRSSRGFLRGALSRWMSCSTEIST
jgi:Domain of unknown function DUF29